MIADSFQTESWWHFEACSKLSWKTVLLKASVSLQVFLHNSSILVCFLCILIGICNYLSALPVVCYSPCLIAVSCKLFHSFSRRGNMCSVGFSFMFCFLKLKLHRLLHFCVKTSSKQHILSLENQAEKAVEAFSSLRISFQSWDRPSSGCWYYSARHFRTYLALFKHKLILVLTGHGLNHSINCSPESDTRDTHNSPFSHSIFSAPQPVLIISKL